MKYIVLLGDGMAGDPLDELGGKTTLAAANTPYMDQLSKAGRCGLADTVPEGYPPGSDVANLSVFGYNPAECYSGRSPLEAASMGVELGPDDVAFRMNFVWLEEVDGQQTMGDFSAGHISTEDATALVETLQHQLGGDEFNFYPGVSYRHLMVWKNGKDKLQFTPPHDISSKAIASALPQGDGAEELMQLVHSAQAVLKEHPTNLRRIESGEVPANSIWFWGHGRKPKMQTYQERFGLNGGVISAVDLIKGIGINAGLDIIEVPGATGYLDTNYLGKAEYGIDVLKEHDFVYVHVEAPDEAGHGGLMEEKVKAIERFDELVVGTFVKRMDEIGDCRILIAPDHPTPIALRTHTSDPVPFIIYDSQETSAGSGVSYSEKDAATTADRVKGHELLPLMLKG